MFPYQTYLPSSVQREVSPGVWADAIPEPYYHAPLKWLWLRLTGYRDVYGRKAQIFLPWQ